MIRRIVVIAALSLAVLLALGYGALRFMTSVPGQPHEGALPALTADERDLAARLVTHIAAIASKPHNVDHYDELEKAARYIEAALEGYGYAVARQPYAADGRMVRNIGATIEPSGSSPTPDTLVVGAHYDSYDIAPGANDNGTGTAAVLELARLLADLKGRSAKRIHLVLFVNEEPPYFQTPDMGSYRFAKMLAERGERVVAMYSMETLGFYSDAPGSQHYPPPLGFVLPDRGNFVSFVAIAGSRPLLQETLRSFRSHTAFPSVGGVAPGFIPGIDWSDHWAFAEHGFQALMVTDTAIFRYPHYHKTTDTPDKIDNEKLARVVKGMERVIRDKVR